MKEVKEQSYEASMERLEEIVARLEDGSLPLEDALRLFEEGTRLAASCNELLTRAEARVTELTQSESAEETIC
ncbi:MAG TPA: exodeoxyribonuclease VII small subunit [Candidatus Fimivicinus intestinavium]|nr:exodeoxyribonuclease VII small subunit [Candidatus Fimivicinus intestinavium]